MLKGLLKIFITLAGLFATVAGLSYLSRKSADQYIEIYDDDDEEEDDKKGGFLFGLFKKHKNFDDDDFDDEDDDDFDD